MVPIHLYRVRCSTEYLVGILYGMPVAGPLAVKLYPGKAVICKIRLQRDKKEKKTENGEKAEQTRKNGR